jgi:purine-binding chemotaxis protein CheW
MQALVFGLGAELFAVEATVAREVVAAPIISSLPTAPASVVGVFNLRGEIVPVFDTATLLGMATTGRPPFVLVVETELGPAGLSTTALGETAVLGDPVGEADAPGAVAAFEHGRRVVVLLDVAALLEPVRLAG